ncbi:MAG TPA: isoamylase early set domain-containing protein [Gemmatimonadaceae bacterium]|nr:isoamylase early set domain-containing protein [Gemmatimonadaceae bacterium]
MMSGDEVERALDARIARALREGVASTPEARERVMRAVRASTPPVRGAGEEADLVAGAMPLRGTRPFWRSPAFGLLAAASVAGVIALVRAIGVEGPIPEVPGRHTTASRREAARAPESALAPAAARTTAEGRTRLARVQFVFVAPQARRVAVVGDFNDWDVAAAPLALSGGVWSGQLDVPFGRHDYAFVVDGERWVRDPNAPQAPADEFGAGYSVLVVNENSGAHR